MKNTKSKKSLSLSTQTLRNLQDAELTAAAGGFALSYPYDICRTNTPSCNKMVCYQ